MNVSENSYPLLKICSELLSACLRKSFYLMKSLIKVSIRNLLVIIFILSQTISPVFVVDMHLINEKSIGKIKGLFC